MSPDEKRWRLERFRERSVEKARLNSHKTPTIADMEAEVERLENELEEARGRLEQAQEQEG